MRTRLIHPQHRYTRSTGIRGASYNDITEANNTEVATQVAAPSGPKGKGNYNYKFTGTAWHRNMEMAKSPTPQEHHFRHL